MLIDRDTVISASGSQHRGGEVTIWSDHNTQFLGRITATGHTGRGGDAKVSSHGTFNFNGPVDLLSRHGAAGDLLLDPYDLTMSTAADANSSGFKAAGSGANINTATLASALTGANVTVATGSSGTENGDITLANPLSWSASTTLTLNAAGSIHLNAGVTNSGTGSRLVLNASGSDGISGSGALANAGTLMVTGAGAPGSGDYTGTLTTASGARFTYTSSANQTLRALTGSGTDSFSGSGTLTIRGSQAFGGTLNLNQATTLNASSGRGVGNAVAVNIGATVTLAGASNTFLGQAAVTTPVTINSGGRLFNPGSSTFHIGSLTLNCGELALGTATGLALAYGSYALDRPVIVTADSTISAQNIAATGTEFDVAAGVVLSVPGIINHICDDGCDQGFTKSGAGTTVLSGMNNYTAATQINGGILALGSAGALGDLAPILFGGGTLQYGSANQTDYSDRFANSGGQAWSIDTNGQSVTFASDLQGAGSRLSKSGTGRLTLTGGRGTPSYDGTLHRNGYALSGLVAGDSVTGVAGLASGRNAGSYRDALLGRPAVGCRTM